MRRLTVLPRAVDGWTLDVASRFRSIIPANRLPLGRMASSPTFIRRMRLHVGEHAGGGIGLTRHVTVTLDRRGWRIHCSVDWLAARECSRWLPSRLHPSCADYSLSITQEAGHQQDVPLHYGCALISRSTPGAPSDWHTVPTVELTGVRQQERRLLRLAGAYPCAVSWRAEAHTHAPQHGGRQGCGGTGARMVWMMGERIAWKS